MCSYEMRYSRNQQYKFGQLFFKKDPLKKYNPKGSYKLVPV